LIGGAVQLHRVPAPQAGAALCQTTRRVVAFFFHPDGDFVVRCLDGSDTYEPITDDEHYAAMESQELLYK